jgi:hypothetical protein
MKKILEKLCYKILKRKYCYLHNIIRNIKEKNIGMNLLFLIRKIQLDELITIKKVSMDCL